MRQDKGVRGFLEGAAALAQKGWRHEAFCSSLASTELGVSRRFPLAQDKDDSLSCVALTYTVVQAEALVA